MFVERADFRAMVNVCIPLCRVVNETKSNGDQRGIQYVWIGINGLYIDERK